MLANLNKVMNEKVKKLQQQLRVQDERIVALETENAILYLKLAQCQGAVHSTRAEAAYLHRLNEQDDRSNNNLREKICLIQKQFKALKKDFSALNLDLKKMPEEMKASAMFSKDDQAGIVNVLHNLKTEHNVNNSHLQNKLVEAETALDEAMRRANEERTRRRTLHNTLVELRGNIRVHCRVRPLLATLDSHGDPDLLGLSGTQSEKIVDVVDEENVTFNQLNSGSGANKTRLFEYERVYGSQHDQKNIFKDVAPLLTSLLDGYNVCIMAYGQTGSGKTHTMLGYHSLDSDISPHTQSDDGELKEGVIPRSAKEIFRLIKERESSTETYSLEVSVFEVYNNEIVDLLAPPERRDIKHGVFSASDGSQEVPSLTTKKIYSAQEVMDYLTYGMTYRHEDSTKVHTHSSRSHLIVQLNIYQTNEVATGTSSAASSFDQSDLSSSPLQKQQTQAQNARKRSRSPALGSYRHSKSPVPRRTARYPNPHTGNGRSRSPSPPHAAKLAIKTKLQLVDLAGSECVGMSGVTGNALRETSNINKSLSALADVLQALAETQTHIPYRNTKLTHVLQDTIGGDSKLLVMLCVSPAQKYGTESLQCLGFGSRARQVARGPAKKRRPTGYNLQVLGTESSLARYTGSLSRSASARR